MKATILSFALILIATASYAQNDPVSYMNQFTDEYLVIQEDMWDYTRTVSHGRSAKKVEKRRMELIQTSTRALNKAERLGDYEGDVEFKEAVVEYFSIINSVLKEDYEKIVDMEEIAEQSYDLMEAYMMAREAANDKQQAAAEMVNEAQKAFAEKHDIELINSDDDTDSKMEIAGRVFNHYNEVYLIFFKSSKQELYLIDAMSSADLSAIEQNKEALKGTVEEGLGKLDALSGYEGDESMIEATENLFRFYEKEGEDVELAVDFFLKKENFDKIKEAFDQIKEKNRTQEDVDKFNTAVNELNAAVEAYNETNEANNKERSKLIDAWNSTAGKFTDRHVPKGK